jgi:phosphoribosyl-AMP cyclohydrolase
MSSNNTKIEESVYFTPEFDEKGLLPVITCDFTTGEVLMLAWMNLEALENTIKSGKVHYWSRSRNDLWLKGSSSGGYQIVREIRTDCDQDALLVFVDQQGPGSCHTGRISCFYRTLSLDGKSLFFKQH